MNEVLFVRELPDDGYRGNACLVRLGDDYFVVSTINYAPDHGGSETLAFPAYQNGEVIEYEDVAGGRGWTREQTIAELAEKGPHPEAMGRGIYGDTKPANERTTEEMSEAAVRVLQALVSEFRLFEDD